MSYWVNNNANSNTLTNYGLHTNSTFKSNSPGEFYEFEIAIVLDVILNENHPIFLNSIDKSHCKLDAERSPLTVANNPPLDTDIDYSWIGRILVRPIISEKTTDKDKLLWAFPLEHNISEYPLVNELVAVVKYNGKLFYTRKINFRNWVQGNLDFAINNAISREDNLELYSTNKYQGKKLSYTSHKNTQSYKGFAGQYYVINNRIRNLKRWEGDLTIESRHGQSLHFTAYDDNRINDDGHPSYIDYKDGHGNPMLLIRNRQRPILQEGQVLELRNSPNKATIIGNKYEKNIGGYIKEDINHDGSSIHITSGKTISQWVTTCYKKMYGTGEETSKFQGVTDFKFPILNEDQIILNTDRLILSSRYGETFHFSKKRYSVVTDNEYTVDAHDQIVLTTNQKTVINSPAIYLGEVDQTNEPVILGQTAINWLYELCNWLLAHSHWYLHSHVDAGKESPSQTQLPVQFQQLINLRDKLHTLLSRRVFTVGGGLAPGQNGGTIINGKSPVTINTATGDGVPGKFNGTNYRPSL